MKKTAGTIGTLLLFAALVLLWPAKLGGSVTYVVTHGISMQPDFHTGDLAITRAAGDYQVGDVVAYRSETLHTTVLHRIVARDGERYVFKGDNNSWQDPEHPRRDQLLGKLWVHVPKVGSALHWLATPLHAGLLGAGLLLALGGETERRRRRRDVSAKRPGARWQLPEQGRPVIAGLAAAAVAFGCLGLYAVSRPGTAPASTKTSYDVTTSFGYGASTPPNLVYPSGKVATGDPIYTKLIRRLTTTVDTSLATDAAISGKGSLTVALDVSLGDSWHRTTQLVPPTAFTGNQARASGTVSLDELDAEVQQVAALTGLSASTYTVTVQPHIAYRGRIAGQPVTVDDVQELAFKVSKLQITPVVDANKSPFKQTTSRSVIVPGSKPAYLSLRGHELSVRSARWIGILGALFFSALAVAALAYYRRRPVDEVAAARTRFGVTVVPISATPLTSGAAVDVASADALGAIARDYQRVVLYDELTKTFYVEDEGTVYRLRTHPEVPVVPEQWGPDNVSELRRGRHRA